MKVGKILIKRYAKGGVTSLKMQHIYVYESSKLAFSYDVVLVVEPPDWVARLIRG